MYTIFLRLIQKIQKKLLKQLTLLFQPLIIFCWIICVWRNGMVLVFLCVSSLPVSVRLRSPHLFTLLIVSYRLPLLQSSFTFHQDIKDHKRKKVNEQTEKVWNREHDVESASETSQQKSNKQAGLLEFSTRYKSQTKE